MANFQQLKGLPAGDVEVIPISGSPFGAGWGGHSEGLIVQFNLREFCWVGNFQPGSGHGWTGVVEHPNGSNVIVVSNGQGYIVDPDEKKIVDRSIIGIQCVIEESALNLVLISDGVFINVLSDNGNDWRSSRIAWDEMRNLRVENGWLLGEASGPTGDAWEEFSLDLRSRVLIGGSYSKAMQSAIRLYPSTLDKI